MGRATHPSFEPLYPALKAIPAGGLSGPIPVDPISPLQYQHLHFMMARQLPPPHPKKVTELVGGGIRGSTLLAGLFNSAADAPVPVDVHNVEIRVENHGRPRKTGPETTTSYPIKQQIMASSGVSFSL